MSAKHTPGPWDAWLGRSRFGMTGPAAAASMTAVHALRSEGSNLFVELSSQSRVCPGLAMGDTKEEAMANARLIAAAPELLEALLAIVSSAERNLSVVNTFLLLDARDAIAKATGEQP